MGRWTKVIANQWVAIITTMLTGLVLNILIARAIGPEEFGVYSIALTFATFAIILIDGGFSKLIQRETALASFNIEEHRSNLRRYAIGHAAVCMLILALLALVFFSSHVVAITVIYFFLVAVNGFFLAVLRGNGELIKDAHLQTYYRLMLFVIVSSAILLLRIDTALQIVIAYFLSIALFVLLVSKSLLHKPKFKVPFPIYKAIMPLVIIDLMAVLYLKSDVLLLNHFDISKTDIGHYSAAYRFLEISLFIVAPINLIIFRNIRMLQDQFDLLITKLFEYSGYSLTISVLVTMLLHFMADDVVIIMFGPSYAETISILKVLVWAILFVVPNTVMNQMLLALGLEVRYAFILASAAISNILLNIYYIPKYGIYASAWISVFTEITVFVLFSTTLFIHISKLKKQQAI